MLPLPWFLVAIGALAGPAPPLPVQWDVPALSQAPHTEAAPANVEVPEGIQALCFDALSWKGKPTRVFAYLGLPANASPEHTVPGIVLVHGAGGTAFARWVKLWVDRGYAAIAFDHDGGLPVGSYSQWERNSEGGPRRGDIAQLNRPVEDQWMYHAVADTVLAASLLAAQPGVDPQRIGATGISWGGVIVCNAAAVDPRLKFVVPVYGCGFLAEEVDDGSSFVGRKGTADQRAQWSALWDPRHYLPHATAPMLWLAGTNDFAFTISSWRRSCQAAPGTRNECLRVRMPHSHGKASENPEEILAFADSIVRSGPALPRMTSQGLDGREAWARIDAVGREATAQYHFTKGTGRWQDRLWETMPAQVEGDRLSVTVPPDATVGYFSLKDGEGLLITSEPRDLSADSPEQSR